MKVKVFAGQQFIHIGIAAGAQQIVHPPAVFINAIVRQCVGGNGGDRAHKRQVRPQAIKGGQMGALQLAGARHPHPLAWVMAVPDIQIAHLRAFRRGDAEQMPGRHFPGEAGADRHPMLRGQYPLAVGQRLIKIAVDIQGGAFGALVCGRIRRHIKLHSFAC